MRLLVAEDHPSLARSIADGLREEGYAVDLTFDGAEAAHLVKANEYDCVVLDLMLPNRDGLSILRELRGRGDRTPVLIRVETRAGHGAGKPVAKMIEEDADIYAFLLKYLGVE